MAEHCGEEDIITPMPSSGHWEAARNWEGQVPLWRLPARIPELIFWKDTIQRYKSMSQRQQILRGNFYNHIRARDIRACIPRRIWNSYFKFCCERNPWDKVLSRYAWQHRDKDKLLPSRINPEMFDAYLQRSKASSPPLSDFSFYTDSSGGLLVDRVIRFENLEEDFGNACNHLGLTKKGDTKLDVHLKQGTRASPSYSYRDAYSKEQQELVAQECRQEIEHFGYEF